MKATMTPRGLHMFNRDNGLHVLFDEIIPKDKRWRCPIYVQIGVTYRCPLKCVHCYTRGGRKTKEFNVEELLHLLHGLDSWGTQEVAFGGGCPLMYDDFSTVIRRGWQETNIGINFTTNATRITDKFLKEIEGHTGQVRISLDGLGKVYQAVRGVDAFDKVDRGIKLLRESNFNLGINTLLTRPNFNHIKDIARYALDHDIKSMLLLRFKPVGRGKDVEEILQLTPKQELGIPKLIKDIKDMGLSEVGFDICSKSYRMGGVPILEPFELPDCGAGSLLISITPDGKVAPCSFYPEKFYFGNDIDKLKEWYNNFELPQNYCNGCKYNCYVCPLDGYCWQGCEEYLSR